MEERKTTILAVAGKGGVGKPPLPPLWYGCCAKCTPASAFWP